MKGIRVYVEGCLDASLVNALLHVAMNTWGKERRFEIKGLGGKPNVISRFIDDLEKFRVIAFIDADEGVYSTKESIVNIIKEKRVNIQLKLEAGQNKPPHIDFYMGGRYLTSIILWAKPPEYQAGTVEDIICILFNDYCSDVEEKLFPIASVLCKNYLSPRELSKWIRKLSPLICTSLCLSEGTLIWDPNIRRCGFNIIDYLINIITKEEPVYIRDYIELIYNIISKM